MISDFKELNKLFEEIDKSLKDKVHFFVIEGAMLLYHGMKRATKDIDVIVDSQKEFITVENILKKLKFSIKIPTFEYKKMDINQIFARKDFKIDLFKKKVCKGFTLSDTMKKRAQKIIELKHLTILLCSNEDVFLFKTFTEREGDIDDCIALAQRGIDWEVILEELKSQIKISGNKIWITWVGERLDILEERGLTIPIMNEVNRLREEYFKEHEKIYPLKINYFNKIM